MDCRLDEVRRAEDVGIDRDSLRREGGLKFPRGPASIPRVTSRVFAPNCESTIKITPGSPLMEAALMRGSAPSTTRATSPNVTLAPFRMHDDGLCDLRQAVRDCPSFCSTIRWLGVSIKPAPRIPVDCRAAAMMSSAVRLY